MLFRFITSTPAASSDFTSDWAPVICSDICLLLSFSRFIFRVKVKNPLTFQRARNFLGTRYRMTTTTDEITVLVLRMGEVSLKKVNTSIVEIGISIFGPARRCQN